MVVHGELARAEARRLDPLLPWHSTRLTAEFNTLGLVCDAEYANGEIRFGRGTTFGLACESTSAIADFIDHEIAHALHDVVHLGGIGGVEPAVGEASADYFTSTLTDDPSFGRGLHLNNVPIRRFDPSYFEYL